MCVDPTQRQIAIGPLMHVINQCSPAVSLLAPGRGQFCQSHNSANGPTQNTYTQTHVSRINRGSKPSLFSVGGTLYKENSQLLVLSEHAVMFGKCRRTQKRVHDITITLNTNHGMSLGTMCGAENTK